MNSGWREKEGVRIPIFNSNTSATAAKQWVADFPQ
jgi:hypothetical protein